MSPRSTRLVLALAFVALSASAAAAQPVEPAANVQVSAPDNDDGRHVNVAFDRAEPNKDPKAGVVTVLLRRSATAGAAVPAFGPETSIEAKSKLGDWTIAAFLEGGEASFLDEVDESGRYVYAVVEVRRDDAGKVLSASPPVLSAAIAPNAAWFHTKRVGILGIVLLIIGLIGYYIPKARKNPKDVYIRRMPGVDAIEDAVGRSTEMGRPVLYVTGLEEIQDIQTLASLLILGHVAELTATYDTEIKVANYFPMTMVVAEEIVRQGYANAGRMDAHRPENVMFITAEQFAFAAGVNGIILRDRPATNIYFGKFFGESLLLAETGFLTGAVQIAGTAELAQLPFFVAACDYCLIGEEMYATSAYLSREPTLLANLKAGDGFKLLAMIFVFAGAVLATAGVYQLGPAVFP
ncbi:MAG TPA: DUF6754 domain-containing protein [Kofleriaceae bacterium]|nr:DUF6754 domain-containing protein [Kofleriaceae bacterium]